MHDPDAKDKVSLNLPHVLETTQTCIAKTAQQSLNRKTNYINEVRMKEQLATVPITNSFMNDTVYLS